MVGPPMSLNLILAPPPRFNFVGLSLGWFGLWLGTGQVALFLSCSIPWITFILWLVQLVLRRSEEKFCTVPSYRQSKRRHIAEDWAGMDWVRARFHGSLGHRFSYQCICPFFYFGTL